MTTSQTKNPIYIVMAGCAGLIIGILLQNITRINTYTTVDTIETPEMSNWEIMKRKYNRYQTFCEQEDNYKLCTCNFAYHGQILQKTFSNDEDAINCNSDWCKTECEKIWYQEFNRGNKTND